MHDSELEPNTTEAVEAKPEQKTSTKNFVHKFFYAKKNESEEEVRERFLESYSNIEDFEYIESDEYPNGAALVRKQKKASSSEADYKKESVDTAVSNVEVESST
uniref:Uncharacterized protein n=1 Tax=viral metagenome TaxID=1070528 RepID=A0A2V0R9F2_9ZZZZ